MANLLPQFLAPNALAFVQSSLGFPYNQSLGPAATVGFHGLPYEPALTHYFSVGG